MLAPQRRLLPRALPIAAAAATLGLLAQLLFFDAGWGINFPLAVAALLTAGWLAPRRQPRAPALLDAWMPVAALLLAVAVALRGDTTLVALDVIGSLALTVGALASFGGLTVVSRPLGGLLVLGGRAAAALAGGALDAVHGLRHDLPATPLRARAGRAAPVLRGLLLALPLLLLFMALFSSADAVFAQLAEDLFDWKLDLGSLPGRTIMALVAAWMTAGLLAFVARGEEGSLDPALQDAWRRRPRLGTAEAVTVLTAVDLLFLAFVGLQAAYLFGGLDTLQATGLTYADYARRGFFELLAVAFVVGGMVLLLEGFVARRSRAYLAAAVALVILTLVVLASAYLRLRLYQDAYGWTELRFYVLAAIVWLGIGAVGAVVSLWTDRTRWLLHGMLGLSVAVGMVFNFIGPVRFIAEQNVARAAHPELVPPDGRTGLDVWYLHSLGDDAVIVMAEALPVLPAAVGDDVREALEDRASFMAHDADGRAWQAWNYARERARTLVSR